MSAQNKEGALIKRLSSDSIFIL